VTAPAMDSPAGDTRTLQTCVHIDATCRAGRERAPRPAPTRGGTRSPLLRPLRRAPIRPMPAMIELLRAHRATIVARLAEQVVDVVPTYVSASIDQVRHNIGATLDDAIAMLDGGPIAAVKERFAQLARQRIEQGIAPADFLQAALLASPVLREVIGHEADASELLALDKALCEVAAIAATVYAEVAGQRLKAKNAELDELNARLLRHERMLSIEATGASRALETANAWNRSVIESLSSGLMVVDSQTLRLTLFTHRTEELLEIPAERALGRTIDEVLDGVAGLDLEHIIGTVRALGRLPLTRFSLTLPSGRRREVYVRASRMFDSGGVPKATLVVCDDITERELLFDSFARYVSRDLLRRLLAQEAPLGREGETREVTVLCARLIGFGGLGERASAERLHATLDAYFRAVVEGVALHGGFIDKFVGDKVVALFSASRDPAATAVAAVRAARSVREAVSRVREAWAAEGQPALSLRVAVNTGEVVLGNLGNEERMEFAAIGDPVIVADMLCAAAPPGGVLLGEATARLVEGSFAVTALAPRMAPGRSAPLSACELVTW
jgi:class 3 adenylate cyclase/PAS domain-containing protein